MKKFFLSSIIGVIFLGILTSALWDKVFEPVFDYLFKVLLYVSTLGLEKYRNYLYCEIAKGFYENTSFKLLLIVFFCCTFFLSFTLGIIQAKLLITKIKKQGKNVHLQDFVPVKLMESLYFRYFLVLYSIFLLTFFGLEVVKTSYINRSINYYEQLLNIVSSEITDDQYKSFKSEFAEIKTKNDYIDIVSELRSIGDQKKKNLPSYPSFIF